jgi:hypothetical protein
MEPIPPELFLDGYPPDIQAAADRLRAVVKEAVPDAIERVRTGWRLIGYEVPVGKRTRYFAFVAPEVEHVHLGFEYGIWMHDPDNLLRGAHLNLRKVRFVTYEPGDDSGGGVGRVHPRRREAGSHAASRAAGADQVIRYAIAEGVSLFDL